MPRQVRVAVRLLSFLGFAALPLAGSWSVTPVAASGGQRAQVSADAHHDTSAPLRDLKDRHTKGTAHPALHLPRHGGQSDTRGNATGGRGGFSGAQVPSTSTNWEGLGDGFSGFFVNSAPPDTDGAVGPSNYVQIVNESFAVFNKSGTVLYGPASTNTLWSGFGGGCETNNDGDATVVYDRSANRFVISQFSVSTTPYLQCVAVSTTGDPTGSYYRYSFSYGLTNFPDYPKLGVWPDAYYTTFNIFAGGSIFTGGEVAAYNRNAMLNGQAATQQTFSTSSSYGGLLAANVDSSTLPAAGTPEWIVAQGASGASSLAYWKFHVDWSNPANSTFTGPTTLTTETWNPLCGGGTCVPQAGTNQQLDSLADRIMYSLGYRNFGDHESIVVGQSAALASGGGIAWFELRPSGGALTIFQQGIYGPDSNYRWMPSLAMDGSGDIGLGFSLSGSSLHPAIHYSGRLGTDPLGTMSQGEASIIDGAGSQSGSNLSRWGDYSQMSIDPSDDCTFWYTNQYQATTGAFNWHTRIGSFKFSSCGGTTTNDFSIAVSPTTQTVTAGNSTTYTVSTTLTSGTAQNVSFSASGLPSGATASFSPTSVTGTGTSTMTVNTTSAAQTGTFTLTVTGTGTSATHSATTQLTITAPVANDFSIGVSPSSQTVTAGGGTTYTVSTTLTSGNAQSVSFSASGLPSGATASFSPTSVTGTGSSTMTVSTASNTAAGSYTVTVTGTGTSNTHSTTTTLVVNSPPGNDFSISATPASQTVLAGNSTTYSVSTAVTSGSSQNVSLSASGLPTGATASFNPTSVMAGAGSTLTIGTSTGSPAGPYTVTITGTGTSATRSTTVGLTVNASPIVNGGFETGSLSGWTASGTAGVSSTAHSGSFSAQLGSSHRTRGDSSISQTFTIPAGAMTLSFWYRGVCPDNSSQSWATATLHDNTRGTTATLLPQTCANTGTWVQVSYDVTRQVGDSVTLTLTSHDDNDKPDGNFTLYDDVKLT